MISPLLANIALHGMEEALGVRRDKRGEINGARAVVRYADDFVVFCESREDAEAVVGTLKEWLAVRGLQLSDEKTRIVHLTDGFDFLGFTIRHYKARGTATGTKLLMTPSDAAVKRIKAKLRAEWVRLHGSNARAVVQSLNPIVRGWANYHRVGVASRTFRALDHWMFGREKRYVRRTHPTKPWYWCKQRYWGRLNQKRNDHWVFGDKHTGGYLVRFGWTKIQRHILVRGSASPDDPALRDYWAKRTLRTQETHAERLSSRKRWLAQGQQQVCPLCGEYLLNGEAIHEHHLRGRKAGVDRDNVILVHLYCHQRVHATRGVYPTVRLA